MKPWSASCHANWEASHECKTEYRVAENLNKQILCARLEPSAGDDLTSEWQRCDLFGESDMTSIDVDGGSPVTFATGGLYRLRDAIRGTGISAHSFVWPPPDDVDRAPYRGWEPFEQVDAAVFLAGMHQSCTGSMSSRHEVGRDEVVVRRVGSVGHR